MIADFALYVNEELSFYINDMHKMHLRKKANIISNSNIIVFIVFSFMLIYMLI